MTHAVAAVYFAVISAVALILTIADKHKAVKGKYRISEDMLLTIALIGGAAAEYITMKCIRHKTQHKKFMIGLPLMILLQIALIILVLYISKL